MFALRFTYVIIVVVIIVIHSRPIENSPSRNGLYKLILRQKRKENVISASTKWFRKFPGNLPLSFQKYNDIIREAFPKDNSNDNAVVRHKKLFPRKIHRTENGEVEDSFVDRTRNNLFWKYRRTKRKWTARKMKHKELSPMDNSVYRTKTIDFNQLLALTNSFNYKHVASFQGMNLKDSNPGLSNESCPGCDNTGFPLAFNVTLPYSTTSIDQAKLIVYLSYDDDHIKATKEQPLCQCEVQVHEMSTSNTTTERHSSTSLANEMTVKQNSWNSIDVTDVLSRTLQNSTLFSLNLTFDCVPIIDDEIQIQNAAILFSKIKCAPNSLSEKTPLLVLFTKNENNESDSRMTKPGPYDSQNGSVLLDFNSESQTPIAKEQDGRVSWSFPRNRVHGDSTEFKNRFLLDDSDDSTVSSTAVKIRHKRRARRRGERNSCRLKKLYVDFAKIRWADPILYPPGYQAYQCVGRCYSPISEYLTPTNHAIIQNRVHMSQPRSTPRACCVPTRLKPKSILFFDANRNVNSVDMQGMIVAECGCR